MRDWSSTLWDASYKGVPFLVERDREDGGRRLGVHDFVGREDPYVEDMGGARRMFEVTGYVASDEADAEIAAVLGVLGSVGAGLLVRPLGGPVLVRCEKFGRTHELDRLGYVAFTASFIRVAENFDPLDTASGLAQSVFDAVDALDAGLSGLANLLVSTETAEWVVTAIEDGLVDLAAGVDLVVSQLVTDTASARLFGDALAAVVTAIESGADVATGAGFAVSLAGLGLDPIAEGTSGAGVLWTLARAVGDVAIAADADAGPGQVIEAFGSWLDGDPDPAPSEAPTASRLAMERNAAIVECIRRTIAFGATVEAVARTSFGSRGDGLSARSEINAAADRLQALLSSLGAADASEAVTAVIAARDAVNTWLSRTIADLAPVRTIVWAAEVPAAVAAWRLYGDPARAAELVARNRLPHPGFVPTTFEALVS